VWWGRWSGYNVVLTGLLFVPPEAKFPKSRYFALLLGRVFPSRILLFLLPGPAIYNIVSYLAESLFRDFGCSPSARFSRLLE
jgi:hypothetical protein